MKKDKAKQPNITEVAKAANVSRTTVSRAFNNPELLAKETVQRVLQAAENLGYASNHAARALRTGRFGNIAIIVPDIENPFFPPVIRAAQSRADAAGVCVFLGDADENAAREELLFSKFASQVDGIVLVSSRMSQAQILRCASLCPLVLINRDIKGLPRVLIDSGTGIAAAVRHLAAEGHRHIVYVNGPINSWSNQQRSESAREEAHRCGITIDTLSVPRPTYAAGKHAATLFPQGPTAAIAFDDLVAQGLMAMLAEQKIKVPAAFSIVGCDDVLGEYLFPTLTTVSSRTADAGKSAVDLLLNLLQEGEMRDVRYLLDTELILRNSTAPRAGS
ncbi:LacI family DNA-binding transcriptional regulator [uncultured Pluralibacter sp.]|uniref:LacI family DNA-binding transcriptional regulator n=1 Tax=uncultured Pluralibacter sp. TaxID=1490864 RepID=UPI00260C0483|nr:LacI family DNA-binding transcriptional regulator [uncultured Pluralibacter sp.]